MSQIDQNSLLGEQQEIKQTSGTGNTSGQSRIANYSTGTPSTEQGSGRFQNLQKYVDANQGGGLQQSNRLKDATNSDISAFNNQNIAKTKDITDKAQEAQTLFAQNGKDYTSALKGWQDSLKTQSDLLNRGTSDTAAQEIKGFTQGNASLNSNPNANFAGFQNLQQGGGYDQQAALNALTQGAEYGNKTVADLQNKAKLIQTETGRNNLLQQSASPYGPRSTMGGNRLNQLLFQADPNAVRDLQNQFGTQTLDVQNKLNDFGSLGYNVVNPLIDQEKALQNSLNSGATGLQSQFESNFANQKNYDLVNNSRKALYNDYVNQMRTNNYSNDLANMLGLYGSSGLVDTYNPNAPRFDVGNISQKMGIYGTEQMGTSLPNQNAINSNQFRTYNLVNDAANNVTGDTALKQYLTQGRDAGNFQDVLLQPDYDTYKAIDLLAGSSKNNLAGPSTLDAAVSRNQTKDLGADIKALDTNFKNDYINRIYDASSGAARATSDRDLFNNSSGNDMNNLNAAVGDGKTPLNWRSLPVSYNGGAAARAYSSGNLNDYLYNSATPLSLESQLIGSGGDNEAKNAALRASEGQVQGSVLSQLQNAMNTSGVKNVATVNNQDTKEQEMHKRLKDYFRI